MRAWPWLLGVVVTLAAPFVACHSDDAKPYPQAFPFDLPQVIDQGGPKLTSPNIVLYIDPNDPQKPEVLAALDYLRTSDYWSTTTSEYGIGPIGDVKVLDPPSPYPAKIDQNGIYNLVVQFGLAGGFGNEPLNIGPPLDGGAIDSGAKDSGAIEGGANEEGGIDGGSTDSGAPMVPPATFHTDAIYVLVLPPTTTVTDLACATGGEHDSVRPTTTDAVPFAFTRSECMPQPGQPTFTPSQILVHEIVEAATDPFPSEAVGYVGVDAAHTAWNVYGSTNELADMCVGTPADFDLKAPVLIVGLNTTPLLFPSVWSNRLAMQGKDPCVPDSHAYPRALTQGLPVVTDQVTVFDGVVTTGVNVDVNQTVTIPVRITADHPTKEIALSAGDIAFSFNGMPEVMATFDRDTAANGDIVNLTIQRGYVPHVEQGLYASVLVIATSDEGGSVYTYLAVGMPPK
jgi:hypothetical protein